MKYYFIPAGNGLAPYLATTQPIAKEAAKARGHKFSLDDLSKMLQDIPVDRDGLRIMLQESLDRIHDLENKQVEITVSKSELPKPIPAPIPKSFTATAIENFILNEATIAEVGHIYECLGTRFKEYLKSLPKENLNEP